MGFMDRPEFGGSTFDPKRDTSRLRAQLHKVRSVMLAGGWHTLTDLAEKVGAPEASVSARLRDLRKLKFGAYTIERRYVERGLFEYHLRSPLDDDALHASLRG